MYLYKIYSKLFSFVQDKLKNFIGEKQIGVATALLTFVISLCVLGLIAMVIAMPQLKDIASTSFNASKIEDGVSSPVPQVESNDVNVAPVSTSNTEDALPPTSDVPALPPEGVWLVTPESGTTCSSSMSANVTPPFNVKVSYEVDATTLIIDHPQGSLLVDLQDDSPSVLYTGADAVAQYELEYKSTGDGSMSIKETISIAGNSCVVLLGRMEYQGSEN